MAENFLWILIKFSSKNGWSSVRFNCSENLIDSLEFAFWFRVPELLVVFLISYIMLMKRASKTNKFFKSVCWWVGIFWNVRGFCVFFTLFFNWKIIALQNFVVFKPQHESAIGIQLLPLEPPSHLPPHSTLRGWYRAPVCVSWDKQQIPVGYLFYIW